ncbi:acyltransferase [Vibrio profundi]|uniref:acyltransferase n=1 Tax=Vibrio profundi TaxID=1774960 RepID=UPI00373675D7
MSSSQTPRIASFELGRVIAILAIIGLHCQMALTYWQVDQVPWVGYLLNQSARFAVPLFFLISGYLIQPKLEQDPWGTLSRYSKPLLKVWLAWSIISLLMPFNLATVFEHGYLAEREGYWSFLMTAPLNSLLEGGLVHLWFIPALVIAVLILAALIDMSLHRFILPVATVLYLYGVLAGSYINLTEFEPSFFTRNGPFFSTLMVSIGFMVRQNQWRISSKWALVSLVLGMAVHFYEAFWLMDYDMAFNEHDFLFGTVFWAFGVFMLLLANPKVGNMKWVSLLSKRMLGIYVSHLLVIILMFNVMGMLEIVGLAKDAIVYVSVIFLSFALVAGFEKTPLKKWLLR